MQKKKTDIYLFFTIAKPPNGVIAGFKLGEKVQKTAVNMNFIPIDVNIFNGFSCFLMGTY